MIRPNTRRGIPDASSGTGGFQRFTPQHCLCARHARTPIERLSEMVCGSHDRSARVDVVRTRGVIGLLVAGALLLGAGAARSQPVKGQHGAAVAKGLSLRAQARLLYDPVAVFERSLSKSLRARINSSKTTDGRRLNACQAPYLRRLQTRRLQRVDGLYQHAALMEQYQSAVAPVASQLTTLSRAWARLHLPNRPMNKFVHALSGEFNASLDPPRQDACTFIKSIAAHHFSYAWARNSHASKLAEHWWTTMRTAPAGPFWTFVGASGLPGPPAAGAKLFTNHQLKVLANLPGEIS